MKTLLLIRHAKSEQAFFGADFDRPLNERGMNDAPMMAKRLFEKKIKLDAFVSSPAERAKTTCQFFAKQYGVSNEDIILVPELYQAPLRLFRAIVSELPNDHDHVALFSHNPGITHFANTLANNFRIDNMPTCSIFAVSIDVSSWADFEKAKKEFLFFDYPKKI